MASVNFKGASVKLVGEPPKVGAKAPDFKLTKGDLTDASLADFAGGKLILNIFPSVDTGVCAASTRRFNAEAAALAGVTVACVSRDLPFAFSRFCGAEGIDKLVTLSELRSLDFGASYGIRIAEGPLAGLLARCVVVIDAQGLVTHVELVPEITQEPDYAAAIKAIK